MNFPKFFSKIALAFLALAFMPACQEDAASLVQDKGYSFETSKSFYPRGQVISLPLSGPPADSVFIESGGQAEYSPAVHAVKVQFETTGTRTLKAHIYKNGEKSVASMRLSIYASSEARQLNYRLVESLAHNPQAYTQGLEFANGKLYESSGQYGESRVERFSGNLQKPEISHRLPDDVFGEGLSVIGDRVYQLTWREKKVYVYDRDLNLLEEIGYQLAEGWGICHNQNHFWVSDGSNRLYKCDLQMRILDVREIYNGRNILKGLNELEFADGKIWANVYQSNQIYRIDPQSGEAEAYLDLSPLRQQLQNPRAEVLNGIAWHPERQQFLVTGKYWDKAFWIEVETEAGESTEIPGL